MDGKQYSQHDRTTHRESKFAPSHGEASKPFDNVCNALALLSQDHVFLETNLSLEGRLLSIYRSSVDRSGALEEDFARRPLDDSPTTMIMTMTETRKCASICRPSAGPLWLAPGFPSVFLDRTDQDLVLEHQRDGDEDEVEEEHGEPESFVHPPLETGDAKDHERQHAEEDRYAAHHAHRVHLHGFSVDQAVQQPRYRKPGGRNTTENPAEFHCLFYSISVDSIALG
ncbi:hypothetical protein K0M31_000852 [Melipona bicolor]|uniref:Uncharacterized protein n=1 Tax=Melipona bicolor TaxID=60889 RepID=A0AA40GEC0_9HYME|nr:hypothetical protein K0M31_000852 [Melipona bicolor]